MTGRHRTGTSRYFSSIFFFFFFYLGSSPIICSSPRVTRGPQDPRVMVDRLVQLGVNILFVIGGDGSAKAAHKIAREIKTRNLVISVVCIPKTIDNDIAFVDKVLLSFPHLGGFFSDYHKQVAQLHFALTDSKLPNCRLLDLRPRSKKRRIQYGQRTRKHGVPRMV